MGAKAWLFGICSRVEGGGVRWGVCVSSAVILKSVNECVKFGGSSLNSIYGVNLKILDEIVLKLSRSQDFQKT